VEGATLLSPLKEATLIRVNVGERNVSEHMKPFTPEGTKLGLEHVGKFEILYSTYKICI
jgi:hypothetical protein